MATIPDLCDNILPVEGKKSDNGKKVTIITGAASGVHGIVAQGPYHLLFKAKTRKGSKARKDGKIQSKDVIIQTDPYWLILLENDLYIHFQANEFRFV